MSGKNARALFRRCSWIFRRSRILRWKFPLSTACITCSRPKGADVREHSALGVVRIRAVAQAADGMQLRDAAVFQSLDWSQLPGDAEMTRAADSVARNLGDLVQAPMGENYSGPVLFEGVAASQIFAEVLGKNLALTRKPVLEPGNPGSVSGQ